MSINAGPVVLADSLGATVAAEISQPVRTGEIEGFGSERTRAGKNVVLDIIRADTGGAAVVGTISVWGVDLPDRNAGKPLGNAYATAQAETVQSFTTTLATAAYTSALLVPAAVSPAAAKEGVIVETTAFILTATNATSVAIAATGIATVTGGDLTGATAAATHLARALPEVETGDTVTFVGTIDGVAGRSLTGRVTGGTTVTATAFSWDQTAVCTAGYVVNTTPQKFLKYPVTLATVAGPRTVGLTGVAATNPVVMTFAPAFAGYYIPTGSRITAYVATPVQVLATAAHMVEKLRVRSYSVMWTLYSGIQTAANRTLVTLSHLAD